MDAGVSVSAILANTEMLDDDLKGLCGGDVDHSMVAHPAVVFGCSGFGMRGTSFDPKDRGIVDEQIGRVTPVDGNEGLYTSRFAFVRAEQKALGFSAKVSDLLTKYFRPSTNSAYQTAWKQWFHWCRERSINSILPALNQVVDYLTYLFDLGKSYRMVCVHRSMLSCTLPEIGRVTLGQNRYVIRLLRSFYNQRTPTSKYRFFWRVDEIVEKISNWGENYDLPIKLLTFKAVFLIALTSYCKVSELANIFTVFHHIISIFIIWIGESKKEPKIGPSRRLFG